MQRAGACYSTASAPHSTAGAHRRGETVHGTLCRDKCHGSLKLVFQGGSTLVFLPSVPHSCCFSVMLVPAALQLQSQESRYLFKQAKFHLTSRQRSKIPDLPCVHQRACEILPVDGQPLFPLL